MPFVLQYIDMVKDACYKRTEKKWISMKEDEKIYTGSLLSQDLNAERNTVSASFRKSIRAEAAQALWLVKTNPGVMCLIFSGNYLNNI